MLRELRGLARETAVYGLSTVLGRMLSFLLTPLFTHMLDRSESGVVQTAYAYIAFLTVVYGLGLDVAYLRLGRRDGRADDEAFGAGLLGVAVTALAASVLLHFFCVPVARVIGVPAELAVIVRYGAWILAVDAVMLMPYAELRGSHRAAAYAGVKLVGIALNLALAWIFVRLMGLGVRGVFLANLAASGATLAMLAPVIAARLGRPNATRLRSMLSFGLPLALAGVGSMIVQVADRPLLSHLAGLATAGLYGSCYKLGIFMMLLVGMFDQAWKPFILERADRPDADALIARVLTYFCVAAAGAFLAVAFFVEAAAKAPVFFGSPLFHPAYWDGLVIVPIVTLGYLFNGLYFVMLAPLMLDRRTGAVGAATWTGAAVNVAANLLLIPRFGMEGAAWATCGAYAAMAAAAWALGRVTRAVPYEWRRLAALTAWTSALWLAGARAGLALRAVLLAAYPLGLRLSGFLDAEELAELRAVFSARLSRAEPAPRAGG
ncbi:MAG TPA: hypothetical protein DCZ01_08660 [Elusimicrobia bacterium]|nr:MAG: hypothetical protein A2X37_08685 [Elusimicrobia bacterium GWA2_66_18]HAZ08574.1 hypothetical protein [Elusimicrobiota bacterium]